MGTVYEYVSAVVAYWGALVPSGVFAVDSVLEYLWHDYRRWLGRCVSKETRRKFILGISFFAIFLAGFLAWRDEHQEVERLRNLLHGEQGTVESFFSLTDIGNTVVEVFPRAGQVVGGTVINATASQGYLVFFDARATDVTLGTTRPFRTVPAAPGDDRPVIPVTFHTALSIACVDSPIGTQSRLCNVELTIRE